MISNVKRLKKISFGFLSLTLWLSSFAMQEEPGAHNPQHFKQTELDRLLGTTCQKLVDDELPSSECYSKVKELFQAGASPYARNIRGLPVILALVATKDEPEILKLFLDAGADPNTTTYYGKTLYALAAADNFENSCRLLLARGADPKL